MVKNNAIVSPEKILYFTQKWGIFLISLCYYLRAFYPFSFSSRADFHFLFLEIKGDIEAMMKKWGFVSGVGAFP